MKKTVNVNLSGFSFTMDEDAYALLSKYLETLKHAFSTSNYDEDLIDDFEGRIAELLMAETASGAQIVTLRMVEDIISRIGRPEEIVEDSVETLDDPAGEEVEVETETCEEPPLYTPKDKPRHRLYRDPRNKILGGVCSGIASYFGIDVTFVRLLFIVLGICSFSTLFIIYLVLWIAMPEAQTPLQFMELEGESPTLSNIGKTVTDAFNGAATKVKEHRSGLHSFADTLVNIVGVLAKVVLAILAVAAVPTLLALGIGLVGLIVVLVMVAVGAGAPILAQVPAEIMAVPGGFGMMMVAAIGLVLTIMIPLIVILMLVIGQLRHKSYFTTGWTVAFAVVWTLSLIATMFCSIYLDEFC